MDGFDCLISLTGYQLLNINYWMSITGYQLLDVNYPNI